MLESRSSSPLPTHARPRISPRSSFLSTITLTPSAPSAVREKVALSYPRSTSSLRPITFIHLHIANRSIKLPVLRILHPRPSLRGNPPTPFRLFLAFLGTLLALILTLIALIALFVPKHRRTNPFNGEPDTRIFSYEEIRRVWEWEIGSGRYPSERPIASRADSPLWDQSNSEEELKIENPALPRLSAEEEKRERQVKVEVRRRLREQGKREEEAANPIVVPVGHPRSYVEIDEHRTLDPYPRRPIRGSTLDLDRVMERCDFQLGRYVRDCLEVLRQNAGLDTGVRRGDMERWKATFYPTSASPIDGAEAKKALLEAQEVDMTSLLTSSRFHSLLATRRQLTLSPSSSIPHPSHPTADPSCDPDYPRIFHIFWAGPFTDKPYAAALSFLHSQRLSLSSPIGSDPDPLICRPQLWIWINPGPASSLPDPRAEDKMKDELRANPWSSPLLHRRFEEAIQFRLWNTSEQLDGVKEMEGWREMRLFNSGGVKYGSEEKPKPKGGLKVQRDEVAPPATTEDHSLDESDTSADRVVDAIDTVANDTLANVTAPVIPRDELFLRVGSTSASGYDRLSVVLSDMARFVLTHRFGGVYLDADNLLLRDWEELWGWHGAFAYRWSRLEKYNTAVLKMQRNSALGNFIFRTAVANGLDFHPMTISRYMKDAGMEGLLLRLPDALFDPAWLNTEYYQRDRPPFPYFKRFEDFFETPAEGSAAPTALGIDGFFKGSFGYHYHNQWWSAFDPARNFPDLGHRFANGERVARGRIVAAKLAAMPAPRSVHSSPESAHGPSPTLPDPVVPGLPTGVAVRQLEKSDGSRWGDDERDFDQLDWSSEGVEEDEKDLSWATVVKRTYESFIRGERPNMYGEWMTWEQYIPSHADDDDRYQ
ncbi:DDB1- and CUL4-associated factor 13, partial [Phenoliferia sp. Uapishka_3]